MTTAQNVTDEVEAIHVVFERWLRGDEGATLDRAEQAIADDFFIVPPRGNLVLRDELFEGIRAARGSRQLRIAVKETVVRWSRDGALLASYEEWHEHDTYSTTRQSTALFTIDDTRPLGLCWQHVHETWIKAPPDYQP